MGLYESVRAVSEASGEGPVDWGAVAAAAKASTDPGSLDLSPEVEQGYATDVRDARDRVRSVADLDFDLPETVGTGVRTALSLRDQVRRKTDAARTMVFGPYAAIGRRREDEDETASFAALADKMDRVATVLRDPERTRFHVVTTPEVLAVRETDRLLDQLRQAEIPVGTIVVNRVLEDIDDDCERCTSRQARQREIVTDLRATHPDLDLVTLPDRVSDLQGVVELAPLADRLAEAGFAD